MKNIRSDALSFLKWILLTVIIGAAVGLIMSGFAFLISVVTAFRLAHMWMLLLLPAASSSFSTTRRGMRSITEPTP